MMMIMIALKGAARDFFVFVFVFALQSPHCLQHVCSSGQGAIVWKSRATLRALITCSMSCGTWYKGTTHLLSLTEFKSHLF